MSSDYSITRSRTFQWGVIIFVLIAMAGSYFYFRSKAAGTMTTSSSNARPDFEAPLKSDLNLTAGTGTATYSRADGADGRATITDFEGLIRPVRQNEARFEGARRVENLVTYSEDATNATWTRDANTSVTGNTTTAPDGTLTADTLTTTSLTHYHRQTVSVSGSRTYTFSWWARLGTMTAAKYSIYDITNASNIVAATSYTASASQWKRFSVTFTTNATTASVWVYPLRDTNVTGTMFVWGAELEEVTGQSNQNPSEYVSTNVKTAFPYHGAGVDGVKYFATQNGNTVASNIVTEATGTAIPEATLKGYLSEGSRVNLVTYSEQIDNAAWPKSALTVSADQAVAPDGKMSAEKFIPDTSNTWHDVGGSTSITSGSNYVMTIYAKAAGYDWVYINLTDGSNHFSVFNVSTGSVGVTSNIVSSSIRSIGNGWYRCEVVATLNAASAGRAIHVTGGNNVASFAGNGSSGAYIWGVQFEQASFASSYIPTTTASVTRAADILEYPSTGNISGTSGSLYAEVVHEAGSNSSAGTSDVVTFNGGGSYAAGNGYLLRRMNTVYDTGGDAASASIAVTQDGNSHKVAARYVSGSAQNPYYDGTKGTAGTTNSCDFTGSGTSKITVGKLHSGSNAQDWYGDIKNLRIWKQAMSDTFLQNLTAGQSGVIKQTANRVANDTGLVGYWSFEDGSGTNATDFSGNGNVGVLMNGPTWTDGRFGKALNFDGTDDFVHIYDPVSGVLDFGTGDFSVSAWIKTTETNGQRCIVSKAGSSTGFRFGYDAGRPYYLIGSGTNYQEAAIGTTTLNDGRWHHLTILYLHSSNTVQSFIDGLSTGSSSIPSNIGSISNSENLGIGTMYAGINGNVTGQIDDVRIYNRVLSQDEITKLYQAGSAKLNISQNTKLTNGLIGEWSFDGPDISGTTAYDRSGSGNNGTLTLGPVVTEGKIGQALRFDGVDDYVTIGAKSIYNVDVGQALTISAWVRGVTPATNKSFVYKMGSCLGWNLNLESTGSIRTWFIVGNNGCTGYVSHWVTSPLTTYGDNQWHHAVSVIDRPNLLMSLYVDGVSVGTSAIDNTNGISNPDLRVGSDWNNGNPFSGVVDEVRIYNRALSASEVAALYNMGH